MARKTRQPTSPRALDRSLSENASHRVSSNEDDSRDEVARLCESLASPQRGRLSLRLAGLFFGLWFVGLMTLALIDTNPATLNVLQVQQADVVVEAVVTDAATGECVVRQSWPDGAVEGTVTIDDVAVLGLADGTAYLFPLRPSQRSKAFEIVPTNGRRPQAAGARLVYLADDSTREQLEAILR